MPGTLPRSSRSGGLFHVSEEAGIARFDPRASEGARDPLVWAIDADHLRNYLLPRECPRVTYYAGPETTAADVKRFLGSCRAVVAAEPVRVEVIDDALAALKQRGVELCLEANLWPLRDAVVASSLQFSMIRMRNALPPDAASLKESR